MTVHRVGGGREQAVSKKRWLVPTYSINISIIGKNSLDSYRSPVQDNRRTKDVKVLDDRLMALYTDAGVGAETIGLGAGEDQSQAERAPDHAP